MNSLHALIIKYIYLIQQIFVSYFPNSPKQTVDKIQQYYIMANNSQNIIQQQIIKQFQQQSHQNLNHQQRVINYVYRQQNQQNAHKKIHHHLLGTHKIKIIYCLFILASLYLLYSIYLNNEALEFKNKNIIDNNSRLLFKNNIGQGSNYPITINNVNDVPRWANYYHEESSDLREIQRDRAPAPSILKNQKGQVNLDASAIIFGNSPPLNYEVVAGITGQKLKLGQKLLQLNMGDSQYGDIIYHFQRKYYEQRYEVSKYEELPFCIIVPTYNNAKNDRYKINLQSISKQQYNNYRVIIIDDNSQDQTANLIKKLIKDKELSSSQFKLIENKAQMKALHNIRTSAISYCDPKDIMMIIDGDDQLIGKQVIKLFNAIFQKDQVWFAYSNFVDVLTKNAGYSRPIPPETIINNAFRSDMFYTSHLRAFYTSLFLKIKEEDLKNDAGNYYQAANDVAICIPILEMSQNRVKYIPQLTYGYNSNTGFNNHHLRLYEQQTNKRNIVKKTPYKRLDNL